ncbi:MAG: division/cell wall cluster transcriptional repressor MraZ [Chloroflexota bacterium]|jgi:MraZ protein|nr:division/cell wall cluster transcriptional repressor MraZ [Chloroflexota bacterium]
MFLGRFAHNLDAKGRLAIPARFRAVLEDGVVLTRGIDRCVTAYPMPVWNDLAEKISALSMTDPNARQFRRMMFAEAANLDLDGQGRIVLPAALREFAGIDREVVVIGVNSSFEIWSPERWREIEAVVDDDGEAIASHLAGLL